VAQARAAGQLIPAGEGQVDVRPSTTSVLTRAEVKAETLQARQEGTLVPAGEGEYGVLYAGHGSTAGYPVASARRNTTSRVN
jgi:hypothetical protein